MRSSPVTPVPRHSWSPVGLAPAASLGSPRCAASRWSSFSLVCVSVVVGCGSAPRLERPSHRGARPRSRRRSPPRTRWVPSRLPDAAFVYRFKQTEPAASGTFSFRDRDLSFSFRPSPSALYFGVENLQAGPSRSTGTARCSTTPRGGAGGGHSTLRWRDRFQAQAYAQVMPQQRYSDYLFPLDDLLDPGASPDTAAFAARSCPRTRARPPTRARRSGWTWRSWSRTSRARTCSGSWCRA